MSYEHGTTHYNLPLTEGTDKRDWFDTNQAFENVDAALFAASEAAGSASADVENVKEDVTALQGRMTSAESDIRNVEAAQATQGEQVIALTNRVNSIDVKAENKFNSVAVKDAYNPESIYSVGDYCTYDGNLYECITAITTGEPFDADKWTAVDLMSLIGGSGGVVIDDTTTSTTSCWSSSKTNSEITTPHAGDVRFNSGKLQQYDGTSWVDISIGGGSMLVADFTSYATGSSSGGGSFTAQEPGFIVGASYSTAGTTSNQRVTINSVPVTFQESTTGAQTSGYAQAYIPYKTGDAIVVTGTAFKCYKAVTME